MPGQTNWFFGGYSRVGENIHKVALYAIAFFSVPDIVVEASPKKKVSSTVGQWLTSEPGQITHPSWFRHIVYHSCEIYSLHLKKRKAQIFFKIIVEIHHILCVYLCELVNMLFIEYFITTIGVCDESSHIRTWNIKVVCTNQMRSSVIVLVNRCSQDEWLRDKI